MADRYRRPDIPDHVACPQCTDGKLVWHPYDEPWLFEDQYYFGVWNCDVCDHVQDFVHWLTPGATRRLHTQPETFGDDPEYVERYDIMSDKMWWERAVNGTRAVRRSRRARIYQVAYTDVQYQLIRWAMWSHEVNGWMGREIYQVLKHFWRQQLGQTPFVSGTVHIWFNNRKKMAKRGLEWP